MKNSTKMLGIIGVVALLSACDGAPSVSSGFPLQQVDTEYEIDTWGFNSEVYEFTPKSNPNKACVMLMLDGGQAMGLQCFDKPSVD